MSEVISLEEEKKKRERETVIGLTKVGAAWAQAEVMTEIARLAKLPEHALAKPALYALAAWLNEAPNALPDADIDRIMEA